VVATTPTTLEFRLPRPRSRPWTDCRAMGRGGPTCSSPAARRASDALPPEAVGPPPRGRGTGQRERDRRGPSRSSSSRPYPTAFVQAGLPLRRDLTAAIRPAPPPTRAALQPPREPGRRHDAQLGRPPAVVGSRALDAAADAGNRWIFATFGLEAAHVTRALVTRRRCRTHGARRVGDWFRPRSPSSLAAPRPYSKVWANTRCRPRGHPELFPGGAASGCPGPRRPCSSSCSLLRSDECPGWPSSPSYPAGPSPNCARAGRSGRPPPCVGGGTCGG
jgi:hypothetical protein